MLNSRLIIDTPYDQTGIVIGYSDKAKYQSDQYLHLDLLGGATNLISVVKAYSSSYSSSSFKTLLDCRDYLLAKALLATLQSVLFTDDTHQTLTAHADKAVTGMTSKAVYPSVIKDKDLAYASFFGTLAYYFMYVQPDGYPSEYLNKLLTYVWGLLGLNYAVLPKDRISRLFKLLGKTNDIDEIASNAFRQVLAASPESELYTALIQSRRDFITEADITNFSLRMLTGKYSDKAFPIFAATLSEKQYDKLAAYRSNLISVLRPVGFNLLLNALVVEGYLRAADYISGLPETMTSISLDDFLVNDNLRETHGNSIASHLATTYDALDFISTYNLFDVGQEPSSLLSFIYNWTPPAIYAKDNTRLFTLFDTIDIDKNNRRAYASSLLEELSQTEPTGSQSITLQSSNTGRKVSLSANNTTSASTPIIVFVTSSATTTPSNVINSVSINNSPSTKTVIADADNTQSIAAVAVINSGLTDGSAITLDELIRLKSDQTLNVSVSNVQVVEGTVTPDGLDTQVNDVINEQTRNYYLYNYLTATYKPRGSINSRYEAQGVRPEVLDTAQIESTFGYREEGYLDEYAARMSGLTKQQKEVHVDSELKVLKTWAESIKQITDSIAPLPIPIEPPVDGDIDFTLD